MRFPTKKIADSVVEKIAEIEATMNKRPSPRVRSIVRRLEMLSAPPTVPGPNTPIQPITPAAQEAQVPPLDEAAAAGADVGGMLSGGNAFDAIINPQT